MQAFEGKTAVVTGGASGIGLALAEKFAAARMNVVLADVEQAALDKAVRKLEEQQANVIGVNTNTMIKESIDAMASEAINAFGKIHILCNNAGVASTSGQRGIWEVPVVDWEWVMGVNFYGVLYGIQAFVPHMLEHGEDSHIVNTASLAGLMPGGGTYGVSKHGVLCLSETLCADLQARNANIGTSALCPGFVNTNIAQAERNRPDDLSAGGDDATPEMLEAMAGLLKGGKQPSEIADAVFEAIREDRLYVLPHPAWDDTVRGRVEGVLARQGLVGPDFAALMDRQQAGEQL